MQRRDALGTAALGLSASLLAACGGQPQAGAEGGSRLPRVRWRMATSWPQSLDTIFGGAVTVCERVGQLSGGRFTIRPFTAGELVPGLDVLDAVQQGSVPCGHTAAYYYIGKNPAFAFGTAVPFGLNAQQQNAWLYEGGGNRLLDELFADFSVKGFPAGNTGTQMGGWFKKQIKTPADLKGLKMRIPGLGGKVMAELGVNVQVLPGGEIFLALERGAIDAAEWTGPYDDLKLGLPGAATYYYAPGWWEPGPTLHALVNRREWEKLPKEYQVMFETACREANLQMLSRYEARNGKALEQIRAGTTQLETFSPAILKAAHSAAADLMAGDAAKDPAYRTILQEWQTFRSWVQGWDQANALLLANAMVQLEKPDTAGNGGEGA